MTSISSPLLTPAVEAERTHSAHTGHAVQFYTEEKFLAHQLASLVGKALVTGRPAIVVAKPAHRESLEVILKARGFDVLQAIKAGRYVPLDATETLSCFMRDGRPDRSTFLQFMGSTIAEVAANGEPGCEDPVIYGEMVALLFEEGNSEAAIALEQLWNELGRNQSFDLLCGYPLNAFKRKEDAELFQRVCSEHSAVIPAESYTSLPSEDLRARTITELQQKAQALDTEIMEHRRLEEELETRVQRRTGELQSRNLELNDEILRRERAEAGLRALSSRILAIRDEERRRIARELHDSTAQLLAALAMNLSMMMPEKDSLSPMAAEFLVQSGNLVHDLLKEVRNLSQLLHPPTLDEMGLSSALEWYIGKFTERSHIQVKTDIPHDLGRLSRDVELAVFRLVQEALTNVQRHSGSRTASVRVRHSRGEIKVEIEDEGIGIAASRISNLSPGIGISGMRERIRQLHGSFNVKSGPSGTTVSAIIPCG